MHRTRSRLTTTQQLGISLLYGTSHFITCQISKFQQFLKENCLSETISRRTCHDTTPHHRPSGTKRIFKLNIGGNLALHYTTKCPIWPAQPFLVDHCIHAQVEVTATTRTALNLSLLNVEYTDLPCLEKKRNMLLMKFGSYDYQAMAAR